MEIQIEEVNKKDDQTIELGEIQRVDDVDISIESSAQNFQQQQIFKNPFQSMSQKNRVEKMSIQPFQDLNLSIDCEQYGSFAKKDVQKKYLPDNLTMPIQQIKNYLGDQLFNWKKNDSDKLFKLPQTKFNEKKQMKCMEQNFENESIQQVPLSSEQLREIWKDGSLTVQSKLYSFPYKWKISKMVIRGYLHRFSSFYYDYSVVYRQLYYVKNRFYQLKKKNNYENMLYYPQIYRGLQNILSFPVQLFLLIFGLPQNYINDYLANIKYMEAQEEISQKRKKEIIKNSSLEKLFVHLSLLDKYVTQQNQKKQGSCINYFFIELDLMSEYCEQQIIQQKSKQKHELGEIDDEMQKELQEQYQKMMVEKLKTINFRRIFNDSNYKVDIDDSIFNEMKDQLIVLYEILRLFKVFDHERTYQLNQIKKNDILEQMKIQNPIRFRFPKWHQKRLNKLIDDENQNLTIKGQEQIMNHLESMDNKIYLQLFKYHQEFQKQPENLVLQKKFQKQYTEPSENFTISRRKFTPIAQLSQQKDQNNQDVYYLKKKEEYQVNNSFPFWRIYLFLIRAIVCSWNTGLWLLKQSYKGQFGILALFSRNVYARHIYICKQTGEIKPDFNRLKIYPYIKVLQLIKQGIDKSNQQFKNSPDKGLLPKSTFGRFFHFLEIFFFRFLFVGVILTFILMPIAILINFVTCIVLAISSWIWVTAIVALYMPYQWFIYDGDIKSKKRYKFIRVHKYFPLLSYAFDFTFLGCFQIVWALVFLAIHISSSLFFAAWGIVRITIGILWDIFMLSCIKLNAREPEQNSQIAWKVAGPGISRQIFKFMDSQQCLELLEQQVEIQQLDEWNSQMKKKINEPYDNAKKLTDELFEQNFSASYKHDFSNTQHLLTKLDQKYHKRTQQYNNMQGQNIRFTQDQLIELIPLAIEKLEILIDQKNMHNYIWQNNQIPEKDYERLLKLLMQKAFKDQDIFIPIESIEQDLQIKEKSQTSVKKIQNTMKGEGNIRSGLFKTIFKKKPLQTQPYCVYTITDLKQFFQQLNSLLYFKYLSYGAFAFKYN